MSESPRSRSISNISFLIPFRTDNDYRQEIFEWNVARLYAFFPDSPIIIGETSDELFNRSEAINDAVAKSDTEYIAILDADTIWHPDLIADSIQALMGGINWVIPYLGYYITNPDSAMRILDSSPGIDIVAEDYGYDNLLMAVEGDPYPPVSGINILRREDMYEIGGFDPRFRGWGWEDRAFTLAANYEIGNYMRLPYNVFHIWHPVGDITGHKNFRNNERLFGEYQRNYNLIHQKFL